jgi:GNAT superfamily N-acetyltransferase
MQSRIDHYEGIYGTPVVALALRGMAELLEDGAADQSIGLHHDSNGIAATVFEQVAGVIVWIDEPEKRRIWLQLGYVLPEYRGKGVYSALWGALVECARKLGRPRDLVGDRVQQRPHAQPRAAPGSRGSRGQPALPGQPSGGVMDYECVKQNKRLWIRCIETGELVYTPPNFIKLQSRDPMDELASKFTEIGSRDIGAIVVFQTKYGPRS